VPMAGPLFPFPGGDYDGHGAPPTLIIHGDADDTAPYDDALTYYDLLGTTPKALLTHIGGGHWEAVDDTNTGHGASSVQRVDGAILTTPGQGLGGANGVSGPGR